MVTNTLYQYHIDIYIDTILHKINNYNNYNMWGGEGLDNTTHHMQGKHLPVLFLRLQ